MSKTINVKLLVKSDTSTNWETNDPVLGQGEIGFDTTVGKHKIGDGVSNWSDLEYFALKTDVDQKVDQDDALLKLNTAAATGTTDGDLYAAITALGWQNTVIVS